MHLIVEAAHFELGLEAALVSAPHPFAKLWVVPAGGVAHHSEVDADARFGRLVGPGEVSALVTEKAAVLPVRDVQGVEVRLQRLGLDPQGVCVSRVGEWQPEIEFAWLVVVLPVAVLMR